MVVAELPAFTEALLTGRLFSSVTRPATDAVTFSSKGFGVGLVSGLSTLFLHAILKSKTKKKNRDKRKWIRDFILWV